MKTNDLEHIGDITTDDGWAFPVYRDDDDLYYIDLGGAIGLSDGIPFDSQAEAFASFEHEVMGDWA